MQRLGPLAYMVEVQGQMRHVHIDHLILGPNGEDITVETLGEDVDLPVERQDDNMEPPHVDNHPGPPPRRNPRRLCGPPKRLDL